MLLLIYMTVKHYNCPAFENKERLSSSGSSLKSTSIWVKPLESWSSVSLSSCPWRVLPMLLLGSSGSGLGLTTPVSWLRQYFTISVFYRNKGFMHWWKRFTNRENIYLNSSRIEENPLQNIVKVRFQVKDLRPISWSGKSETKFAVPTLTSLTDFLWNLPTLLLWDQIWNAEMIAISFHNKVEKRL